MGELKWPEAEAAGKAAAPLKSVFILVVEAAGEVAAHCFVCVSILKCTFAHHISTVQSFQCVWQLSVYFSDFFYILIIHLSLKLLQEKGTLDYQ